MTAIHPTGTARACRAHRSTSPGRFFTVGGTPALACHPRDWNDDLDG
ncbi:MAG TPA: hypothetical protein VMU89_16225 [Thermomicrobiaceae bacterium]|nr:hypothetical protein [Thermomicrobiaceae bacterium]